MKEHILSYHTKYTRKEVAKGIEKQVKSLPNWRLRVLLDRGAWVELTTDFGRTYLTIGNKDYTCMHDPSCADGVMEELWDPRECDWRPDLDEGREMVLASVEEVVDRFFERLDSEDQQE